MVRPAGIEPATPAFGGQGIRTFLDLLDTFLLGELSKNVSTIPLMFGLLLAYSQKVV